MPTRVRLGVLAVWTEMSAGEPPKATSARILCLAVALLASAIAFAPFARAGPYTAVQCAPYRDAWHSAFHFSRNSPDFHRDEACASGNGLGVTQERSRTGPQRHGVGVVKPTAGTAF